MTQPPNFKGIAADGPCEGQWLFSTEDELFVYNNDWLAHKRNWLGYYKFEKNEWVWKEKGK